jgi:hypothetical protein
MLRVFSLTGFNVIFAAKKVFESRIIVGANGIRPSHDTGTFSDFDINIVSLR